MVSADNLNLDCLELIFQFLSGNDLASVALVSKSFLAGVVPRLYRSLFFHTGNAKRYPTIPSPFDVIVEHPNLAVHVRNIDIRTIPTVKSSYNPKFLVKCQQAIALCTNLGSFTCTVNVLSSFLLPLESLDGIRHLRVNATLTGEQTKRLVNTTTKLQSLSFDACSWNVVDAIPSWVVNLHSLTNLTFFGIQDLHDEILDIILGCLPQLTSLHVMACTKMEHVSVLRSVIHTPNLENLSITAWDSRALPEGLPPLPRLQHFTVDTHMALTIGPPPTTAPALWKSLVSLTHSWLCPLSSITFRLSEKMLIPHSFIHDIIDAHGASLRQLAMLDCELDLDSVALIASKCPLLERLAVYVPKKDVDLFCYSLKHSNSLKVLSDVGESHATHGIHASLSPSNAKRIMESVPTIKKVAADGRIWVADKPPGWSGKNFRVKVEKRKMSTPAYWFLPPLLMN